MGKHLLAIAVILTVATGCDNVAWGGIDVQLQPPPEAALDSSQLADSVAAEPQNVDGPILMAGVRDSLGTRLVVVGEVLEDGVAPFPDLAFPEDSLRFAELAAPGSNWTLFSEGVRVGRLVADSSITVPDYCDGTLAVAGAVELVPEAAEATRFLAFPAENATDVAYGAYEPEAHDYDQRVATIEMAQEALRRYEANWPRSVLDARADLRAFQLGGVAGESVAATFMYQDQLGLGSPGEGAYALFVIGQQAGPAYSEAFSWYRVVDTDGKGAPRYFDHLDWDGDGVDEILLDVFGANRRWFAGLDQEYGAWSRSFQYGCGPRAPNPG